MAKTPAKKSAAKKSPAKKTTVEKDLPKKKKLSDSYPDGPDFKSYTSAVDATPLPYQHQNITNLFHDLTAAVEALQPGGKAHEEALTHLFVAKRCLHHHCENNKMPTKH